MLLRQTNELPWNVYHVSCIRHTIPSPYPRPGLELHGDAQGSLRNKALTFKAYGCVTCWYLSCTMLHIDQFWQLTIRYYSFLQSNISNLCETSVKQSTAVPGVLIWLSPGQLCAFAGWSGRWQGSGREGLVKRRPKKLRRFPPLIFGDEKGSHPV